MSTVPGRGPGKLVRASEVRPPPRCLAPGKLGCHLRGQVCGKFPTKRAQQANEWMLPRTSSPLNRDTTAILRNESWAMEEHLEEGARGPGMRARKVRWAAALPESGDATPALTSRIRCIYQHASTTLLSRAHTRISVALRPVADARTDKSYSMTLPELSMAHAAQQNRPPCRHTGIARTTASMSAGAKMSSSISSTRPAVLRVVRRIW